MKKLRKLSVIILSLCLFLSCSTLSYASTGTSSTPLGRIDRYYVQGTVTVQTKQITAFVGFTDPSVYLYPEYTVRINATYVNNTTGVSGSTVYTYTTMAPRLNLKWNAPANCSFTGATASFIGTYKGYTWSDSTWI